MPYPLQGTFAAAENGTFLWNGVIHRTGLPDLNVSLQYDPKDPSGAITGTISDGTNSAPINLARAGFDAKHPTALAGNYTVLLPASPDFPGGGYPQGDGYALLTVKADGSVRFLGRLGDGTAISQSGALTADGRFAIYLPLYGGRGTLSGWVDFQPVDDVSDFNGTLHWSKPGAVGGPLYAAGFDMEVDLMGSRFLPPLSGRRILNLENGIANSVLLLGEGNLDAPMNFAATLDTKNLLQAAAPASTALKFTIAPASGLFTGTFMHPGTKKATPFSGVVFQKQNLATGVFTGSSKSGYVSLRRTALSPVLLPPARLVATQPLDLRQFNVSLDFNDNQTPPGWTLMANNSSTNPNASVTNQRYEARQVDTYASLSKGMTWPAGASSLEVSYTGNVEGNYWGMGEEIHVVMADGTKFTGGLGKAGYGAEQISLYMGLDTARELTKSFAPAYGNYRVKVTFRNRQMSLEATLAGASAPSFSETTAVPALDLSQMAHLELFNLTTTGVAAWMDDVTIRFR